MNKIILSIFCIYIFPFFSFGQLDTIHALREVEISAKKIRKQSLGAQNQKWKIKDLAKIAAQNISELISSESGIFIKSYGSGSLATSSIRGGSAGHNLVLWNGFSLQSPILGLLDLSLLPLNSVEEISLQKGGNSAIWGSGAIGGVIGMDSQPNFGIHRSLDVKSTIGSFGNYNQELKIGYGGLRIYGITKVFHQQGENNFKYFVAPGFPKRQQTNAEVSQLNVIQDLYWKMGQNNQVDFHIWQQFSNRNIPPTNVQTKSIANQIDRSTRLMVDWKNINETYVIQGKVGFFKERLDYRDNAISLISLSDFSTLTSEFNVQKFWKNKHKILGAITHSLTMANNDGYTESPIENRSAIQLSYFFQKNNYKFQTSIRQELVDGNLIPLVPSLGFDYSIFSWFKFQGKVSRNYRIPTLNDRFWNSGGNKNLKPESGWSEEATISNPFTIGKSNFEFSITAFNRNIDNWILWAPAQGQPFWSAFNVSKVWSRGLEPRFSFFYKSKTTENSLAIDVKIGYDFIKSTNEVAMELPRREVGEQIIYVPLHQVFGRATLSWKNIVLSYQHSFTGKARGQFGDIDSYHIGNIRMQYFTGWKKYKSTIFLNIKNSWNVNYIVVERRPMPGTHFQLGIKFSFNNFLNTIKT
ncbi:TonB-dependent receptor [Saprospiraceae bacterium]|nr:TonB-dependent receptor [Saprospiraceae bacterium]